MHPSTSHANAGSSAGSSRGGERAGQAGLALCTLLSAFGTSSANVALPALQREFGAGFAQVQWVVLAYLLGVTALVAGAGRLGDLFGRRRLLLAGLAQFTVASALCGAAPTLGLLIAGRAMQGAGAALMLALSMALAGGATGGHGRAMGLLGSMSAVGTALAPALGGLLLTTADWRMLFFAHIPLGLLTLLLAGRGLRSDPPAGAAAGFDLRGCVLLALTLCAYALAMTGTTGATATVRGALLGAAIVLALLFVRRARDERGRTVAPLVPLSLLRDPGLAAGFVTAALAMVPMMATLIAGPFYLGIGLGLAPAGVGLAMAAGPVAAALAGLPAGRLADRVGTRSASRAGLTAMAVAALALASCRGLAGWVAPLTLLTAGYALFQAANNAAVMGEVAAERRGVAAGLLGLARNLGLVTGAALMGAVFAAAAGTPDLARASAREVADGMRTTFGLCALAPLLALGVSAAARRP